MKIFTSLTLPLFLCATPLLAQSGAPCIDSSTAGRQMKKAGMVSIALIDSSIQVDLKYSSADNFLHQDIYGDLCNCYLAKEAAMKLAQAQKILKKERPGLFIKAFDCARPRSVQWKMWDLVKGGPERKYVAYPGTGSLHNYGCAVDGTIADSSGAELDMGTPFDSFDSLAQPRYEEYFLKAGRLSKIQVENRRLLRRIMVKAGFHSIGTEWWHFEAIAKNEAKSRFSIIE
jgi:zinc D-Ala-D-Ala dipeptidase